MARSFSNFPVSRLPPPTTHWQLVLQNEPIASLRPHSLLSPHFVPPCLNPFCPENETNPFSYSHPRGFCMIDTTDFASTAAQRGTYVKTPPLSTRALGHLLYTSSRDSGAISGGKVPPNHGSFSQLLRFPVEYAPSNLENAQTLCPSPQTLPGLHNQLHF